MYFAVPPIGQEPSFAVATRGKQTVVYRLIDLVDDRAASSETRATADLSASPPPGTIVRSSLDADEGQDEEGTDNERG